MCGILGFVSDKEIDSKEFENNLLKLYHRGHDDHGIYMDDDVAFGQTRLSIIDLSKNAHQPMTSENYVIIYNGEIYNFKEIKKDLLSKGYKFHSLSDTEVILKGFIEYKEQIVDRLNGMFAFAIYDKKNKEIFLARDRSGIKPLFYYKDSKTFVFSSEMKTLKKYSKRVSFDAKILFLLLGYIPEPFSIYENILMFPAGCYGHFKNNELKIVKYSQYKYEPKIKKTYNEIVSDIRKLFYNSVKRELISDVSI